MQQLVYAIPLQIQLIIFLAGIVLLGIPHGAADLLVAEKNSLNIGKAFSKVGFFIQYLGKIVAFGLVLWMFPVAGLLLFIILSAYHFGETDLYLFKTNTLAGKFFVITYGLVILNFILLAHAPEIEPLLLLYIPNLRHETLHQFLQLNARTIISVSLILFFASAFIYFITTEVNTFPPATFLVRFTVILVILYNLPMLLAFFFYFIVWHSTLSMRNIFSFLQRDNTCSATSIIKQIALYSSIAIAGVLLFGYSALMLTNYNVLVLDIFLGLAVLTAPHLHIMHNMYISLRINNAKNVA